MKFPLLKHPLRQDLVLLLVLVAVSAATCFLPEPERLARQAGTPVSAKVVTVDNANVVDAGLIEYGSQNLTVHVDGTPEGEVRRASNELRAQMELDKKFAPGDRIVVVIPAGENPDAVLIAKDYDRSLWMWTLAGAFALLLLAFGGWTGVKALFSFLLSCLVIWKVVIPLALLGWNPSWVIFGCVVLLTAAIQYLVAGLNRKGTAAFLGATAGVFLGLALAQGFTALLKINGAVLPYSQALYYSGYEFLNLQELFSGAMILACSGAVMDLAMDIASGMDEVVRHAPEISRKKLIASGLRIGRSVVGTMTTTLLLAYSGGYITLLMMFYSEGITLAEIINNPLVASEVVKTLIGSFSLILVAPFTALFAGMLFVRRK